MWILMEGSLVIVSGNNDEITTKYRRNNDGMTNSRRNNDEMMTK